MKNNEIFLPPSYQGLWTHPSREENLAKSTIMFLIVENKSGNLLTGSIESQLGTLSAEFRVNEQEIYICSKFTTYLTFPWDRLKERKIEFIGERAGEVYQGKVQSERRNAGTFLIRQISNEEVTREVYRQIARQNTFRWTKRKY